MNIDQLTARAAADWFAEKLRDLGSRKGTPPRCPALGVFLGDAAKQRPVLGTALDRFWPDCPPLFLALDREGAFRTLDGAGGGEDLEDGGAERLVSALFSGEAAYEDSGRLWLYGFLEADSALAPEDLETWLDRFQSFGDSLRTDARQVSRLLILMLDEEAGETEALRRFLGESGFETPILILSSVRSDGRVAAGEERWRIAAAVMAVSDGGEEDPFASGGVFTAGYARAEKPIAAIADACTDHLLQALWDRETRTVEGLSANREALRRRLGAPEQGTFPFLESYAPLSALVPAPFQLELFPVPAPEEEVHGKLSGGISAREFDELTFGAWGSYLSGLEKKAREVLEKNPQDLRRWGEEYGKSLRKTFSPAELDALAWHGEEVRELLSGAAAPSDSLPVREYAERYLRYLAAASPLVLDTLSGEVKRQGEAVRDYLDAWRSLLSSRTAPREGDFAAFYGKQVDGWLEDDGEEIEAEFRNLREPEGLEEFLKASLEKFLKERERVLDAPLDEELGFRFEDAGRDEDPREILRHALTGDAVPVYLQTSFYLGQSVRSFFLLRQDAQRSSSLYNDLQETLGGETEFYETGRPGAAEALNLYAVTPDQLL